MNYKIYQLKVTERTKSALFMSFEAATRMICDLSMDDYSLEWNEDLEVYQEDYDYLDFLNGVFRVFNIARPRNFKGHSVSISDIIELDGTLYYVDTFGFVEINNKFEKIRSVP